MIGLDTNILLRWLLDDSIVDDDAPEQAELVAAKLLQPGARFFVNDIVLAETIWVLRNKIGKRKDVIADVVDRLLASTNIEVEDRVAIQEAKSAYLQGSGDFADELIASVNLASGCSTTFTFDRKASRSTRFTNLQD